MSTKHVSFYSDPLPGVLREHEHAFFCFQILNDFPVVNPIFSSRATNIGALKKVAIRNYLMCKLKLAESSAVL